MEAYKTGWPILMEWCKQRDISKWYIAFFSLYINSVLCFIFYNLGFFIVYALQLPSIEKYKILKDEKWPWVEQAKGWKATILASILRVSFNFMVLSPVCLYILSSCFGH